MKMLKMVFLLAMALFACHLNAELVDFGGFQIFSDAASKDGDSSLIIDSSVWNDEFVWYRYVQTKRANLFEFDANYKITFKAKVEGYGSDAFLFVLVRPDDVITAAKDIATLRVNPTNGKEQSCNISIYVPEVLDYRLQFHSHNRIRAEISDIKIEKVPQNSYFIGATEAKKGEKVDVSDLQLPTGAKEFEVEMPRIEAENAINAADYGLDEKAPDNTAALNKAVEALRNTAANKLIINKGSYRFAAAMPVNFSFLRDVTIDGNGATFINTIPTAFVRVDNNDHVRIINLNLDWDWDKDPIASLVEVVEKNDEYADLRFVHYDDFPKKDTAFLMVSSYDMTTKSVGYEGGHTLSFANYGGARKPFEGEWVTPNTARFRVRNPQLKLGTFYRLQHYYYHGLGIGIGTSRHIRLENINIYSCTGHALGMSGTSEYVLMDKVNIVAPTNDPRRVITCSADHFHVSQSRGFIKLENCEFSLGADDIFNMHDCSGFGRRDGDYSILTDNARSYGHIKNGTKIEVRHSDYSPAAVLTLKATERIKPEKGIYRLSFEEKVPEELKDGFILFDKTYDTHNIIVRNCLFHDNRARGLLILARDVTVENNIFRHQEMGAIKIETGYTLDVWSEGYGVSNVVIRNNLFDNVNPSGSNSGHRQRSIYAGIYLKSDPSQDTTDYPIISGLLFDHNLFLNSCGVSMYLSSVHNVFIINNMFKDNVTRKKNLPYRAQIYLKNAHNIRIYNNQYKKSDYVAKPGVFFDSDTCSGVDVKNLSVK